MSGEEAFKQVLVAWVSMWGLIAILAAVDLIMKLRHYNRRCD